MQLRREAEARARGEQVDYLTTDVPREFRVKLWYALIDLLDIRDIFGQSAQSDALEYLWRLLIRQYGKGNLANHPAPIEDLRRWILEGASAEQLMDVIEHAPDVVKHAVASLRNTVTNGGDEYITCRRLPHREAAITFTT